MKITQLTIKRPITTFMFFLGIVLLGFVSLRELSVDLLPDISYPRLSVVTEYPGVAPEEIETFVTMPLEAAVSRIPGLRRVESVSKEGQSFMTLEFSWGTNMDFAMLHTREKLDGAPIPEQAEDPVIIPLDPQSKPIMVIAISGDRSLLELKEFSEELIKPRLEQIEGIGSAEIDCSYGGFDFTENTAEHTADNAAEHTADDSAFHSAFNTAFDTYIAEFFFSYILGYNYRGDKFTRFDIGLGLDRSDACSFC